MKIGKKWLLSGFLAILLLSLTAPLLAQPASASDENPSEGELEFEDLNGWKMLKTDIITVLFPRDGKKPMFLWWNTSDPQMIYVVKYQGLIEYFTFDAVGMHPEYYMRLHWALADKLWELYIKAKEDEYGQMGYMLKLALLRNLWQQILAANWHLPYLWFNAGIWNLTEPEYIRSDDGTVIGVAFAFKLVAVPFQPRFDFAVDNIMIKLRFYNTTVTETVPDTDISYTVNPGEMKMDFVVNKWVWNIDTIRPLIIKLKEYGVEIPEGRARLALQVNLASLNLTKLQELEEDRSDPEDIEHMSTSSHMEVEGNSVPIAINQTMLGTPETPILVDKPAIKLGFATDEKTLKGFFKFVSWAKVTKTVDGTTTVTRQPVKAAYIAAGFYMRLFIGYPYFGNGTLEHDPSIGVDVEGIDTTPQYQVNAPTGTDIMPVVVGKIMLPLVTLELAVVLIGVASVIAAVIYAVKWRKKTINMVGVGLS